MHYIKGDWPERNLNPSEKNVVVKPLVDPKDVLLPPLHIKLGLMKNFVKGMNQEGRAFKYIREKFPKLSDAKVKEGIFVGPQIRELVKDPAFDKVLEGKEKEILESLQGGCSWIFRQQKRRQPYAFGDSVPAKIP